MFNAKTHVPLVSFIALSLSMFSGNLSASDSVERIQKQIREDARSALMAHAEQQEWKNTEASIEVWMPEPWIEANECNGRVSVALERATKPWGRVGYEVACSAPEWRTRARATVSVKTQMAIAQKSLRRGDTITQADVSFEQRSMDRVYSDILSDMSSVVGKRVLRSIRANSVIPEISIAKPYLVEKNAPIVIQVDTMGIQAAMKGIALENGSLKERVSVRNSSSGKVLSATVTGKSRVTVSP